MDVNLTILTFSKSRLAFKWEMVEDAIDRGELYKSDGGQYKTYYSQSEAKGKRIESLEEVENNICFQLLLNFL